jgi:hypothetical protein
MNKLIKKTNSLFANKFLNNLFYFIVALLFLRETFSLGWMQLGALLWASLSYLMLVERMVKKK